MIVSEIGKGGMGIVYEAQDLRLPRRAALKFLPDAVAADQTRLARFRHEAESLSRLNHPHICTIYEIGTYRRRPFIAMERLEGQTLRSRLEAGPLTLAEVFDFGLQIADALGAAHAQGIVHRDVKPGNVFITTRGVVKLLDFGVAKQRRPPKEPHVPDEPSTETTVGSVPGTPGYMSPEHIRQHAIDGRSDLFSFGALLYRMTCGRSAFDGVSPLDTINNVLYKDPPPVSSFRPDVPLGLDVCIATLLRKNRDERYPSTHEVMEALRQLRDEAAAGGAAMASLAVLPFASRGVAPDDYFGEGLADELITCLARLEGIRVTSRTSAFEFKGDEDLADVGRRLRVRCVLHGTARRSGDRVRISARLVDVATGAHLWSENYERDLRDIFDVQEEIAERITNALQWRLQRYAGRPLLRRYTDNPEVYNKYLEGRYWLHQQTMEGFARGCELFEAVLREEPHFAPALAGLADYCTLVGFFGFRPPMEVWPEAKAKAQQAIAMDPSLGAAHTSLALALSQYEWDFPGAEREHREAIRLSPGDARARYFYGLHVMLMGRLSEAMRELTRALELDPLSKQVLSALAYVHYYAGNYQDALRECRRTIALDPGYFEIYGCLGLTQLAMGKNDQAIEAFDEADRLTGRQFPLARAFLAYAMGIAGRSAEARDVLDGVYAAKQQVYVPPAYLAVGEIGLGNIEQAFAALEEAYAAKDGTLLYLRILPVFQPLRSDPRFESLCRRLTLPAPNAIAAGSPAADTHTWSGSPTVFAAGPLARNSATQKT
jgi:serine/threonine protein kinase/tetratricopeptide (TPR) repeat protein